MAEEISRFVGGDVDSIIDDFVSWDNEVSSENLPKLHEVADLADLFGDDAEAILEELKSWDSVESAGESPPCKRSRSMEPGVETQRFPVPTDSPKRKAAARGVVPQNTEASTQWALRNFGAWVKNREVMGSPVPKDLLKSHDPELVCKWISLFVLETRQEDGERYPPGSIRNLVSGLNRVLQSNKAPFSILDKGDLRFRDLTKTLDTVSSSLHKEGIGVEKNSASVISMDDENLFWEKGVLGSSTPKLLQVTVFFMLA